MFLLVTYWSLQLVSKIGVKSDDEIKVVIRYVNLIWSARLKYIAFPIFMLSVLRIKQVKTKQWRITTRNLTLKIDVFSSALLAVESHSRPTDKTPDVSILYAATATHQIHSFSRSYQSDIHDSVLSHPQSFCVSSFGPGHSNLMNFILLFVRISPEERPFQRRWVSADWWGCCFNELDGRRCRSIARELPGFGGRLGLWALRKRLGV